MDFCQWFSDRNLGPEHQKVVCMERSPPQEELW